MAPRRGGANDSVVDGLKEVYQMVSSLKLAPDAGAHGQILDGLAQALLKIIQQIQQQKAQQAAGMQQQMAQAAAGGGPGGVNPMMGGPSGPPSPRPIPGTPGGPPSQGSPGIAMPDPDEMRRMLQASGQGG